jgi:probable F420-dependent oxidoreductase
MTMSATGERRMRIGVIAELGDDPPTGAPRFSEIQAQARKAEEIGLDSFWVADHLLFRRTENVDIDEGGAWEAFTFLAGLAASTERIALGPLVAATSFRNPALLAKMADSMDEISNGRFILGVGAGWHKPEYDAFGFPYDHRASRFEEALRIIMPLLREGRVDFAGEYYSARDCVLRPRGPSASAGGSKLWIGGRRPRMLELTAQYADAWNTVWHRDAAGVTKAYADFVEACARVGRDPAAVELTAGMLARVLLPGEESTGDWNGFAGSADEVAAHLREFADAGVKHLVVVLGTPGVEGVARMAPVLAALDAM